MKIAVCSAFRDAEEHIGRYFAAAGELRRSVATRGDRLYLVIGDGDSTDETPMLLRRHVAGFDATIADCAHGGRKFGSVVSAERFKNLAYVGNRMLENVPTDADYVVILDGDLIWTADTTLALVDRLADYPAVAPMILHRWPEYYGDNEPHFRDTWAFRRGRARFSNNSPFHRDLGESMLQLESAGGCLAMRAEYARQGRFTEGKVIVGLCEDIYAMGGSVWLDPSLTVWHP